MKKFILLFVTGLFIAGCAQEAFYTDHEYGMAQNDAFERQIVHKDYAHANKTDEGMAGIHAEQIMDTYHNTFNDSFSSENIDITQTGSE